MKEIEYYAWKKERLKNEEEYYFNEWLIYVKGYELFKIIFSNGKEKVGYLSETDWIGKNHIIKIYIPKCSEYTNSQNRHRYVHMLANRRHIISIEEIQV